MVRAMTRAGLDRRTFLSGSALGTAAALVGGAGSALAGCGAARTRPVLGEVESAALWVRLDRGLGAIRDLPAGSMTAGVPWELRPDHQETILRLGLESLVIADVTRSIPAGSDLRGALRERLASEIPTLERTVGTYHAMLSRMPPAARRNLDRRIRERPGAAMDVAEWLDGHAGTLGVAGESRLLVRETATNVEARVRRQSASALIDDSLAKVERALRRSAGARGHATSPATVAMIDAVWRAVDDAGGGAAGGAGGGAVVTDPVSEGGVYTTPTSDLGPWNESWARPGDYDIEVGAILMPFGLLTCTILLWVGLGILIHGMNLNAAWDGRTEAATRGGS